MDSASEIMDAANPKLFHMGFHDPLADPKKKFAAGRQAGPVFLFLAPPLSC